MNLTGKTRLLGVIGHPIDHSLSPRMHNASFAATGMDFVYVPMDVEPESLPEAVRGLAALGFRGFNVTMPHKEAVALLVDELDEAARVSGAVNTVVIEGGKLIGLNTDGGGFVEACKEVGVSLNGRRALILGAGGAASAVAVATLREDAAALTLVNRTPERATKLRERLRETLPEARVQTRPVEELEEAALEAEVLINTTYLGMKPEDPLPFPDRCLEGSGTEAVCDLVYSPGGETELVWRGREAGLRVVAGGRMLLYQGALAQKVWTGREPDVEAMGRAIS